MPRGGRRKIVVHKRYAAHVGARLQAPDIEQTVERMFGNVKLVDPDILERKKIVLSRFLEVVAADLRSLLRLATTHCISSPPPASLEETIAWGTFISRRGEFIEMHPHAWVSDDILDQLQALKHHIVLVDGLTNRSVSRGAPEAFANWDNTIKYILPSRGEPYNFNDSPEALPEVFSLLRRLEVTSTTVIKEIVHPSYDWVPIMDRNINRMLRNRPGNIVKLFKELRSTFIGELPKIYLKKLKVSDRGIDWGSMAERIAAIDREKQLAIFNEAKELIMGDRHPELRETAERIFGAEVIEETYGVAPLRRRRRRNRRRRRRPSPPREGDFEPTPEITTSPIALADAPAEALPDAPAEALPDGLEEALPDAPAEALPDDLEDALPDDLEEEERDPDPT